MIEMNLTLVTVSALTGGGIVLLAQRWGKAVQRGDARLGGDVPCSDASNMVDADLEIQLARARRIPGAEQLLDRLARQPVIFARELVDFAGQLDKLERKAKVEAARKHAASERRAPMVARIAREAIADMGAMRARSQTHDIRNAAGELVAIARPSCAPADRA